MPTEQALPDGLDGVLWLPDEAPRAAVLVVAGSSGRIDHDRTRVLAEHGALAASIRWFGGVGQSPGICEIPLETFTAALDELRRYDPPRLAMVGVSKGAEAALLVAGRYRLDHVLAVSPSSVVWANVGPGADGWGTPYRSSWTWRGEPLAFVPYDDTWPEPQPPVACRSLYERSLAAYPAEVAAAAIPVGHIDCDVTLVAGADDEMWPSDLFARQLAARRRAAGRPVTVLASDTAGHRPYFPGEPEPAASPRFRYGGDPAADAELGARAFDRLRTAIGLD
ncbi:acyl-CoA thioester hydrolase/BAAT C-terminal domain-containing protein [Actinocatenispora rupis]|uniref:Acyl-CoA thioesterase n=1 Tax=Actinocatenispora rupis TaxID=519421 RepID=A0A8J3JAM5_9ACTN|nr:acyl-CoA thioester hydrolase/BAAT C-terminal domain-containing protein [Actinocatenispora rupis]GID13194.1 acyl-CoA thioesterase [Actinocatenispora rupis]